MTSSPLPPDPPQEWAAAEYALGLTDADARREAEARLARDPAFTREVERWTAHLQPLLDGVAGVEPSPAVWSRIQAAVGGGPVIELAAHRVAARESVERLTRRASMWRGAALAAGSVAAGLAVAVVGLAQRPARVETRPALVTAAPPAVLATELKSVAPGGSGLASYDPVRRRVLVQLPLAAARGDRAPELWLIPADGKPRALGMARFGALADLPVAERLARRMTAAAVLAVSLEPPGGSPTGLPTGPVVAKGALAPA